MAEIEYLIHKAHSGKIQEGRKKFYFVLLRPSYNILNSRIFTIDSLQSWHFLKLIPDTSNAQNKANSKQKLKPQLSTQTQRKGQKNDLILL
jgi:hypothetical protein